MSPATVISPSRRPSAGGVDHGPALSPPVLQVQTDLPPAPERSITAPTRIPAIALGVLLAGYMLGDKAFAYLHLPGTPLFVGEVVLAIIGVYLIRFYPINDDRLRSPVRLTLVVFLLYSALRTLPYLGQYGIDALRDASQWYYGILAFFVADLVRRRGIDPIVGWFGKILPWFVLWAPISLILSQVLTSPLVPDSDVPIAAHRGSNTSVLLTACLGFMWLLDEQVTGITKRQRAVLTAVSGLFLVVAGIQNRGGFLAAIAGLCVIFWYARVRATPFRRDHVHRRHPRRVDLLGGRHQSFPSSPTIGKSPQSSLLRIS